MSVASERRVEAPSYRIPVRRKKDGPLLLGLDISRALALKHFDDLEAYESGLSIIESAARKRKKLLNEIEHHERQRIQSLDAWRTANALEEKQRVAVRAQVSEVYGAGMQRVKTLEKEIDDLRYRYDKNGSPLPELAKKMRSLRSYRGWITRHQNRIEAQTFLSTEERARLRVQRSRSEHPNADIDHQKKRAKTILAVDKEMTSVIDSMRDLPIVTSPIVYGRLDGSTRVDYTTHEGKRAHKNYYLLSSKVMRPETAEVIARYVVDDFASRGEYRILANTEFQGMLRRFASQFGDADISREVLSGAIEGVVNHLRSGMMGESARVFDRNTHNLTDAQINQFFELFGRIADFQAAVQAPQRRADSIESSLGRLPDGEQKQKGLERVRRIRRSLPGHAVHKAFSSLILSPALKDDRVFEGSPESVHQRKLSSVFSIPGLGFWDIQALINRATTFGGRRDISSTPKLRNLLETANLAAKQSSQFEELRDRVDSVIYNNGQLFDQADQARWRLEQDRRTDSQRMPLVKRERKALRKEVLRRSTTLPELTLKMEKEAARARAFTFSTAPKHSDVGVDIPPTRADVWLSDILHRAAELALSGDKKVTAMLSELRAQETNTIYQRVDASVVASRLFQYVYDRLPWWQQGKAGYSKVDAGLFMGMASRWVQQNGMKGADLLKNLDETSPGRLSELFNPSRFGLTQKILDQQHEQISI